MHTTMPNITTNTNTTTEAKYHKQPKYLGKQDGRALLNPSAIPCAINSHRVAGPRTRGGGKKTKKRTDGKYTHRPTQTPTTVTKTLIPSLELHRTLIFHRPGNQSSEILITSESQYECPPPSRELTEVHSAPASPPPPSPVNHSP